MIRLYRIPLSTNVERVTLALAHKGLAVESIVVDPKDRSLVREVSGQDLVPVIDEDGTVVTDSMRIVRHLEARHPDPPLYPADPARRAEMLVFVDWFDRVWKRPPNVIYDEMKKPVPDEARIDRHGRAMTDALDIFEDMLAGRDYLMGQRLTAADCAAFPFVKYAILSEKDDPYLFHEILRKYQPLGNSHPRVEAWIRRVDALPRA